MNKIILISGFLFLVSAQIVSARQLDQNAVNEFIESITSRHEFDYEYLKSVFNRTHYSQRVIDAISKPAEALPWYKYKKIFLQPDRILGGVEFWEKQKTALEAAEKEFGIPADIIVAIIGVETRYGKLTGNDRVMDALSTLSFHYSKRSKFFLGELEQFLLLTREHRLDPLSLTGSYAGAMGIPQFIPSSYRRYARDFDGDGFSDIWQNPVDAIGSVGNYLKEHGWQPGGRIIVPAEIKNSVYSDIPDNGLKPDLTALQVKAYGLEPVENIPDNMKLKVLTFENIDGDEVWLGMENFYVITRYNHSHLYAMAVFQLAERIREKYLAKELVNR